MGMIDLLRSLISEDALKRTAKIYNASVNSPFECQTITLDLTTARTDANPYIIPFPFKSFATQDATTNATYINVKFNSNDSGISNKKFKDNASLSTDMMFDSCFITHPAQSGQSIEISVFVSSVFTSGSLINSGTIAVAVPTVLSGPTRVTLSAATAAAVAPILTSRKTATLQNKTGASIWIGDSTVTNAGATEGIEILDDGIIYHTNTDDLWAYSVAGGSVAVLEEA